MIQNWLNQQFIAATLASKNFYSKIREELSQRMPRPL